MGSPGIQKLNRVQFVLEDAYKGEALTGARKANRFGRGFETPLIWTVVGVN